MRADSASLEGFGELRDEVNPPNSVFGLWLGFDLFPLFFFFSGKVTGHDGRVGNPLVRFLCLGSLLPIVGARPI